ncbi:glycoside hydrolase family 43 protein [Maribellus sediminis]|uniref:glycoside hydrolase family 43 protein n=1 Tax=Maribellus sediminis TaxID=2696285 RepID=UPI001430B44B|nr:glycoside hydrolase family 43 protein [Maribellus sediminis]
MNFKQLLFVFLVLPLFGIAQHDVLFFSYFKGNGEDGLHLAYSNDGYKWNTLKNDESFLTPAVGESVLMRDPCIILGPDKQFHMVWTAGWTEKGIGYASSKDLITWSEQKYIPVMEHEATARNCWAPEIVYDDKEKQYMIFWSTTIPGRFPETEAIGDDGYNHRMYYVTTKDFETFSDTKLLYDRGFNVIDGSILKLKNKYVLFLKDETRWPDPEKNIRWATATTITGPYSDASEPITGNYWAEGPTCIKSGDKYIVYFDKYRNKAMGAVESTDLKNWKDISEKISFTGGVRHGTVFRVPENIAAKIIEQYK